MCHHYEFTSEIKKQVAFVLGLKCSNIRANICNVWKEEGEGKKSFILQIPFKLRVPENSKKKKKECLGGRQDVP